MTTDEMIVWARQWAEGQCGWVLYDRCSPELEDKKRKIKEAKEALLAAGLDITTSDFGTVVIELPFKL